MSFRALPSDYHKQTITARFVVPVWAHGLSRRISWDASTKAGFTQPDAAQFSRTVGRGLRTVSPGARRGEGGCRDDDSRSSEGVGPATQLRREVGEWRATRRRRRARALRGNLPEASDILLSILQAVMCHGARNCVAAISQLVAAQRLARVWGPCATAAALAVSVLSVQVTAQQSKPIAGTFRMISLGIDTSADRMALHGKPLPAASPVGRILSGTITIERSGVAVIRTALVRQGRSDAEQTLDSATITKGSIGNLIPLVGRSERFLHRVNGRWYFLPGQAVRIALEPIPGRVTKP